MDLEHDLTRMLESSVDDLQPPVAVMVTEAGRLGRRRRFRRRIQITGAAAVVVAMAGAGAVVGLDHRPSGPSLEAAGPATRTSASAAHPSSPPASPAPTPTPTAPAPPKADLTWQAMLKILAEEVPPGATFGNLDTYGIKSSTSSNSRELEVQYNDGNGASTVMVTLRRGGGSGLTDCAKWSGGTDEGPRPNGAEPVGCSARTLADGSRLFSYVTGADVYGLYDDGVVLTRPNGEVLQIVAANATLNAFGSKVPITVTRPKPPLGIQGWEAVAQSPRWQFLVPQSTVDAGAAFAEGVSRFPCPVADKAKCGI